MPYLWFTVGIRIVCFGSAGSMPVDCFLSYILVLHVVPSLRTLGFFVALFFCCALHTVVFDMCIPLYMSM